MTPCLSLGITGKDSEISVWVERGVGREGRKRKAVITGCVSPEVSFSWGWVDLIPIGENWGLTWNTSNVSQGSYANSCQTFVEVGSSKFPMFLACWAHVRVSSQRGFSCRYRHWLIKMGPTYTEIVRQIKYWQGIKIYNNPEGTDRVTHETLLEKHIPNSKLGCTDYQD